MRKQKGFTLIELMIVIAIIAIIAAIAIPGLLQSQRASNERNASASLKTMATAEADFRANDRDANRVQDYWTFDVAGLYTLSSTAAPATPIKLIDISIAGADVTGGVAQGAASVKVGAATASTVAMSTMTQLSPKAGYWYGAMIQDDQVTVVYRANTDGGAVNTHNTSRFGFAAVPDALGASGNWIFIINENNTIFKLQPAPATVLFGTPGALPPVSIAATSNADNWPTDTVIAALWSKLD